MDEMKYPFVLPEGTVLAEQYTLIRVLGQDGSGITYEAKDQESGERVAIREYSILSLESVARSTAQI